MNLRELRKRRAAAGVNAGIPPERSRIVRVDNELVKRNKVVCDSCEQKPMCFVWHMLPCRRKKTLRGDPIYTCPAGRLETAHKL